jgi:uncharacterized pyridoxal phosphate-containing UPF0001 family protein
MFSLFVNLQTDKMKLIILKFHIFYTYFTIKKILEVNKKQNKNLKQIPTPSQESKNTKM